MYSKKYQHPKFPLREFDVRWEARFQQIEVFFQQEKIVSYRNLRELKDFPVSEHEALGKLELKFIEKPMGFELLVDDFNSPQNQRFSLKRIRALKFLLAIPFVIYGGVCWDNLMTYLSAVYRYPGMEEMIVLSGTMALYTLITFICLQLGKPFLFLFFFWLHNVFGFLLIMLFVYFEVINRNEYSLRTENLIGFTISMCAYFGVSFFMMRLLYRPALEWSRQKKFLATYHETLD